MNYVEHKLTIDFVSGDVQVEGNDDEYVLIQQLNFSHRLFITLKSDEVPYEPCEDGEAVVVQFAYRKPNGVLSDCAAEVNENVIVVDVPQTALDIPGVVFCEVRFVAEGGSVVSTPLFRLRVGGAIYDEDRQEELVPEPSIYDQILASEAERVAAEEARREEFNEMLEQIEGLVNLDYNSLGSKPSINGVELMGDLSSEDLGLIGEISNEEILQIWNSTMTHD